MQVLVVRKSGGLGDIVCCEPVIRGLRKKHPHAEITFFCPTSYGPLFEGRQEAAFRGVHYARLTPLWLRKYQEQYDICIDLCGPEATDERDGSPDLSRTESFCKFAGVAVTSPMIVLTEEEKQDALRTLNEHERPWTGLGTRGMQWTKNWPSECWAELVEKLPGTQFYFDESEPPPFPGAVPVVGRGLREVAALFANLDLLVTVDTGLLHLGAAVGATTLSVWGPTDPRRTLKHYENAFYVDPRRHRVGVGCVEPCLNDPWNCLGEHGDPCAKCMRAMPAGEVIDRARQLLDDDTGGPAPAEYFNSVKQEIPEKTGQRVVFAAKHLLPAIGGAEQTALEMIGALRDEGYDVVAVWSHDRNGSFRDLRIEESDGVTWLRAPEGLLPSKVLEAKPDLVLTQLEASVKVANVVPKSVPLILYLHSVAEHLCDREGGRCPNGSTADFTKCSGCDNASYTAMKPVYRCADAVLANSVAMAELFEKFTGRAAVVQYPVTDRSRCETQASGEVCVAVGVSASRGRDFLMELARAMPEEQFLWVRATDPEIPNVEVQEETADLTRVFARAFLNLTPHDRYQAFGRTPVEAGWAGVPTLTLDNGGLPEAVGEGGIILPKKVDRWVAEIRRLREEPKEWAALSECARARASCLTWDPLLETVAKCTNGRGPAIHVAKGTKICAEICMKNEEDMIGACVEDAAQWADQIVILDDGSSDRSVEIASECPKVVDIYLQPDKGNVRNEAQDRQLLLEMAQATGCEWICFLDADERFQDRMKQEVHRLTADPDVNLYYFLQVNFWRGTTHYRVDEMWYKGWFGRLFRNFPELSYTNDHNEHCGGIPGNIPDAGVWPSDGGPKGRKSDIRVKHYGFVDWNRTVKRAIERWQRDPYCVKNGIERGGFLFYERMISETTLELREYEGDEVGP